MGTVVVKILHDGNVAILSRPAGKNWQAILCGHNGKIYNCNNKSLAAGWFDSVQHGTMIMVYLYDTLGSSTGISPHGAWRTWRQVMSPENEKYSTF